MRRLTDARIANLKPQPKQFSVPEPSVAGLELRISLRGRKSWSLRRNGKRLTLGTWPEMDADAARAASIGRQWVAPTTLTELVDEFLERSSRKTKREDERVLRTVALPYFGNPKITQIRRRDLVRFVDHLAADPSKTAAVNRYWGTLRRALRWAVEADLLEADPTTGIRTQVKELPRERLITDDELRTIWFELRCPAREVARVTIATGLRVGEVVSGRWEHVTHLWRIPAVATKAQRPHDVPVTPMLTELLDDVRTGSD